MTTAPPTSKPPSDRDDALAVVRRLRESGHVAYFAGGCVRDALMGLTPKDYDVATDAPPTRVRELFTQTQAVGAAFGVVLVRHRKSVIEVATFRTDGKYEDGRRPSEVHFTTAEEDAKRRDFTINGLFEDPIENRVIDYVGGRADIESKTLRAIGDPSARFEEDHLRLLRAVRFAARFGLKIELDTGSALTKHAEHLKRISPERVADELRAMLTAETRAEAFTLLRQNLLLNVVLRVLPEHTPRLIEDMPSLFLALSPPHLHGSIPFALALAALVLDFRWYHSELELAELLGRVEIKRSCDAMRQALKISNDEYDIMTGVLGFGSLIFGPPPTVAQMKRFLNTPTSGGARLLMRTLASLGHQANRIAQLESELIALEQTDFAPAPLITGDDLTAAGLQPGPAFKQVLVQVYDAQLESRVTSREDALAMALQLARDR